MNSKLLFVYFININISYSLYNSIIVVIHIISIKKKMKNWIIWGRTSFTLNPTVPKKGVFYSLRSITPDQWTHCTWSQNTACSRFYNYFHVHSVVHFTYFICLSCKWIFYYINNFAFIVWRYNQHWITKLFCKQIHKKFNSSIKKQMKISTLSMRN